MDVSTSLRGITTSVPPSQRPAAFLAYLNDVLAQPSSVLDGAALCSALSAYLEEAAFSDLNASGGNLVVGRQVLSDFDAAVSRAAKQSEKRLQQQQQDGQATTGDSVMSDAKDVSTIADQDTYQSILEMALEKVQPRVLSFEEQATSLRFQTADLLEETGDWLGAARVLQGISLDSGHRNVSDLDKLRTYVRIVRLLLEGDDSVGADAVLKRASLVIHHVPGALAAGLGTSSSYSTQQQQGAAANMSDAEKTEAKTLGLQYKLSQARIYDAQRRFAEAASRFHEVSYVAEIDESERNLMLSAAVTASILAPAGPQRSRILATLIRDERTESLPQHTILTKVFLDQIIRPAEIASFAELLSPHQRAALPKSELDSALQHRGAGVAHGSSGAGGDAEMQGQDGVGFHDDDEEESRRSGPSTVLDRAMMEHNIIATSRLYANITIGGLGNLLDVSRVGAETMVRRMITQRRLRAEIDQVAGLVVFHEQQSRETNVAGMGAGGSASAGAGADKDGSGGASAGAAGGGGSSAVGPSDNTDAGAGLAGTGEGAEDDPTSVYTKRWDASIAKTASSVEQVCARLRSRGFVSVV